LTNDPMEEICRQTADATPEGTAHEVILDREKAVRDWHTQRTPRSSSHKAIANCLRTCPAVMV
jgi:hypothetical protein